MTDKIAAHQNSQPEQKRRQLRSHPMPYNLRCISTIIPQLRRKTDWTRSTMDPLLENDTRGTRVELDKQESTTFMEFMYPDRCLLPEVESEAADSKGYHTMDQILEVFRKKKWYGRRKNGTTHSWLPPSGCPSLAPKSINNREAQLGNFFNNVLGVVSETCDLSFFRWDARSANVPLDGSPAHRKPDITCYFDAASAHSHHWGRVASFCEVKNRNSKMKQGQSFTEIAGKTVCTLAAQDGRYLVPCIRMLGSCICLTIFDRGGSITTHAFDINSSPKEFLRILVAVSLADYSCLGFDTSIEWDGQDGTPADEVTQSRNDQEIVPGCVPDDQRLDDDEMADEEDSQLENESDTDDEDEDGPDDEQPPAESNNGNRRKWLKVVDKEGRVCKIWLRRILSISDSLLGRGTTVWEGVIDLDDPGPEAAVAVKDSWIDPLRKYTEGMILHILAQYGVDGVPELLAEGQVSTKHFRDGTDVNISTHFIRSKLPNVRSPENFHLRVLSRLITRPVGTLLIDFSSLGELLVAFLDCVIAHKDAVERARILHRDISLVNLLLAITNKKRRAHEKYLTLYLSGEARLNLERRIMGLARRGILADWGYAVPLPSPDTVHTPDADSDEDSLPLQSGPPTSPVESDAPTDLVPVRQIGKDHEVTTVPASQLTDEHDITLLMGADNPKADARHTIDSCPLYRTGTWSWMSAELVMAGPGQPVIHNSLHNLESFFYVLVGICVLYSEPSKQKSDEELVECYDQLFNTFKPSILKTLTIQSNLTWFPKVVKHISPYFQPVIPLLNNLRNNIVLPMFADQGGKFHRSTPFDHNTIIRHVVELLSTLKPEAWDATAALDDSQQPLDSSQTQRDLTPTPNPPDNARKRTIASPPLLSVERPPFGRLGYSDSGVYPHHDTSKRHLGDRDHLQVPSSSRLFAPLPKRAAKRDTKPPLPPPLIPPHDSLLTSRRHISWSDSRVSSLRSRDPDEYVPHSQQKRVRVASIQGSSQQGSSSSANPPNCADSMHRRSSRKGPVSKS